MGEQLLAITQLMTYINDGTLTPEMKKCVTKCAFDSIPKQRRLILDIAAKHPYIDVIGTAMSINYPPPLVRAWFEDLQMFGVMERSRSGRKEYWNVTDEHRKTLIKHLGIVPVSENLVANDSGEIAQDESWEEKEARIAAERDFEETL
jgi:hypothetical protein